MDEKLKKYENMQKKSSFLCLCYIFENNQGSIVPFSTIAFTSTPIQKTALFACFRFLIFHPFSTGVS